MNNNEFDNNKTNENITSSPASNQSSSPIPEEQVSSFAQAEVSSTENQAAATQPQETPDVPPVHQPSQPQPQLNQQQFANPQQQETSQPYINKAPTPEQPMYRNSYAQNPMREDIARPAENPTSSENYSNATRYTNSTDGGVGYVWNKEENDKKENAKKKERKKQSSSGLRVFTCIMLGIFVTSFAALTFMIVPHFIKGSKSSTVSSTQDNVTYSGVPSSAYASEYDYSALIPPADQHEGTLTIPQIAAKCSPSAVGIVVDIEYDSYYGMFGFPSQSSVATSIGSGFILNEEGYIITNHHVIEDAKTITVVLHDKTTLEAQIVGSDSLSDIAVIKVDNQEAGVALVPMEIGNSDQLVVGEEVVAIGCPAGIEYMGTVTNGIVSAINRDIEITDSYGRVQKKMTLIQTNATINKGNSGGPLINSRGQVIGINTLKLTSQYEGIGFSIPINGAMTVIDQLIEHGKVVDRDATDFASGTGIIGINGAAVTKEESERYGIPQGVLVYQIDKNSSASKAGLRRGDIITKYNGTEVKTVEDINKLKASNKAGQQVTVTVYRDSDGGEGQTLDITFKLDAQN